MTRQKTRSYCVKSETPEKTARGCAKNVRVHFKNTHAVAKAVKGMTLERAKRYLHNVVRQTEAVPIFKFKGGYGRHAQAKTWKTTQCAWPRKSVYAVLKLLQNAESNAGFKKLNTKNLFVSHLHVNQAPNIRRRTFRAHGRIGPWYYSPTHLEVILSEIPKKVDEKQQ